MESRPDTRPRSPLAVVRRFLAEETYRRQPDAALWRLFRDHADGDALRVLLERIGGRLAGRCRAVTGDPALADDALQETLVQLVRHRRRLGEYPQAVAWLYRTADSRARMLLRSRRRSERREGVAARPEAVDDRPPSDADALLAAVAGLPARERRVVELVYLEGLTHDEAATALGLGRGSVSKYAQRGVERLRGRLGAGAVLAAGGLAPERAAALAMTAMVGGTAPRWLPLALTLGGLGLAAGGAGWLATRATPPPAAVPESLAARTLRLFEADVRPRLLPALAPLAGADGAVWLERVDAFDTRVDAVLAVRHGPAGGPVSRVRLLADADTRHTLTFLDAGSRGHPERLLQRTPGAPAVVLRPWAGGPALELPVPGLTAAVAAFAPLPRDARTAAAAADFRAALARELAGRWGGWRHRGDPARVYRLEWPAGAARPRLAAPPGAGWSLADGRTWYRVEPDGPVGGRLLFEDEPAAFSGDGRRVTLRNGDWWDRDGE